MSSCQCSTRAHHQRCILALSTTIVVCVFMLLTITNNWMIHSLPTCKSCGAPPSDLSFCAQYIPAGSNICIQDNYKDVETNISNVYSSTSGFLPYEASCRDAWKNFACARAFPVCNNTGNGTIVPYEICYSVCKDYAYGCWARDGGAINWALQPVWDVPEQNKKLDYFCSTEVGNPSPCTLGGKVINGGNTLEFSVLLACFIALLTFSV